MHSILLGNSVGQEKEYLLKASFIEKFIRYTQWPDTTLKQTGLTIGVADSEQITNYFRQAYRNYTHEGRGVEIINCHNKEQMASVNILFIPDYKKESTMDILNVTKGKPILVISESEGLASIGTHINFYLTFDETLHFEINEKQVRNSGLRMNILLLDIAKIIKEE